MHFMFRYQVESLLCTVFDSKDTQGWIQGGGGSRGAPPPPEIFSIPRSRYSNRAVTVCSKLFKDFDVLLSAINV